jgi:AraC family transcriptional regulator
MNSHNDTFPQSGSATSDATPSVLVGDASVRDLLDCDDTLTSLLVAATAAVRTDRRLTQRCIQRAATLLGIDLSSGGDRTEQCSPPRSGLASWQANRLKSYIEGKLDSTIRAPDLAGLVRLSTSHFFRAFRKTFGESPVAYVMKRRMLRAQELMLKSRVSLSQVALECGMSDQAHFSRTFRRIVGTNPSVWRRQFLLDPTSGKDTSRYQTRPRHIFRHTLLSREERRGDIPLSGIADNDHDQLADGLGSRRPCQCRVQCGTR